MPVRSYYRWDGEIKREPEFVVEAKTTTARQADAVAVIKSLHTYELPGISAVAIIGGTDEYLDWIANAVRV